MNFAVGVYETSLYVENVHQISDSEMNSCSQKMNHTIEFLTNTSQSKLFIFSIWPRRKLENLQHVLSQTSAGVFVLECTWRSSSGVYMVILRTSGFNA